MADKQVVLDTMKRSMRTVKSAAPLLYNLLEKGRTGYSFRIYPVEGIEQCTLEMLDQICGIDYYLEQVHNDKKLVYGVGCRVQWIEPGKPWHSFTIRKRRESGTMTEFEKRIEAMKKNGTYPQLTLHIYANKYTDEIESFAIAKTSDIMDYINGGYAKTSHTKQNQIGQSEFWIIYWDEFKRTFNERPLYVYRREV